MHKYFVCANGETISWTSVCDGYRQCIDGSDERNCYCQGDIYACLQGRNVSCKVACAAYGHITCLSYQNTRACEQYSQKSSSTIDFDLSSTQESSILTDEFDAFQYSVYFTMGIFIFVLLVSTLMYVIRKKPSRLFFSCTTKSLSASLHRKPSTGLSSTAQQQTSSLNLPRSRYTPAPEINDLSPAYYYSIPNCRSTNDYYEPPLYPDPPVFSPVDRSDSIYYETIKTPSISNSMAMIHLLSLPEPQGFINIRTHCV